MIAAFTICSNNYLPQAITLAESVSRHAPTWSFFIGLVDTPSSIPGVRIPDFVNVIAVDAIGLDVTAMARRYNIVELCTAVKPTYFRHLFATQSLADAVVYLDPDTYLFAGCDAIEDALAQFSVVLTPHHYTPIPLDGLFPAENLALNHGIYNLGFLGLGRGAIADKLLLWWEERMAEHCRIDLKEGWFVDQLLFNYAPIYFDGVHILRHPGINAAYWNYHERRILSKEVIEFSGEHWPLVLYHFSGFSPSKPNHPTRVDVRLDPERNPGLPDLLAVYAKMLVQNGYETARAVPGTYALLHREHAVATGNDSLYHRARRRIGAELRDRLGRPRTR